MNGNIRLEDQARQVAEGLTDKPRLLIRVDATLKVTFWIDTAAITPTRRP